MPVLLGFVGLVIDVGHAYSVQRRLQASADAAALAGAAKLPSVSSAYSTAKAYGAAAGERNALPAPDVVSETVSTPCLTTYPDCTSANAVVVDEKASVNTYFARVLGVNSFSVHAKATACSPCGSRPLNIALVVDRTGSMADNMSDLRSGVSSFLQSLDPNLDWVSLLVLPPAPNGSDCTPATAGAYPYQGSSYPTSGDNAYAVVHESHDYLLANGSLNQNSTLVSQLNCMQASGATAYKQALQAAAAELSSFPSSRSGYPDVIIFETDGAANTAPDSWYDSSTWTKAGGVKWYSAASGHANDILRPCGSAVDEASSLKASGITVMTVAYQTQQDDDCYEAPYWNSSAGTAVNYKQTRETDATGAQQSAAAALQTMASQGDAFSASNATELQTAFQQLAANLMGGTANLIDNNTP